MIAVLFRNLDLQLYSKSKLELNSKKVVLEWCKKCLSGLMSFFFALQVRLQVLKFELSQIKLG